MRPLPTSPHHAAADLSRSERTLESRTLEITAPIPRRHAAPANQRRPKGSATETNTHRAYPWLLGLSTLMAGLFCTLYLTKPVIVRETAAPFLRPAPEHARPAPSAATPTAPPVAAEPLVQAPDDEAFPGDAAARPQPAAPGRLPLESDRFEETNLRIQHVLSARNPHDEDLGRIILEVPVLYQSGKVRWTGDDVAKARELLGRIGDYQEKSRLLRGEAVALISDWDRLVVDSIPETMLRADSPTLPENQGIGAAEATGLNTTESIEIEN